MINIIKKFFEFYEKEEIDVNWNKSNLSFNFKDTSNKMFEVIKELNKDKDEDNQLEESDVVDLFFAIITNRIDAYYNNLVEDERNKEITDYIQKNISTDVLEDIKNNIFLDNNIFNNRLSDVKHEILTKRNTYDVKKIEGYTSKIILEIKDNQYDDKTLEIELKRDDLEELIIKLSDVKKDMDHLIS